MVARFKRTRHGCECRFDRTEIVVLRRLLNELLGLLDADDVDASGDPLERLVGIAAEAQTPTDPVLARLLPDAYPDDPEAAIEFRRYTEPSLRSTKAQAARRVLADLGSAGSDGRVRLDDPGGQAWLSALNDLRLALGTRLEVTEESYEELERMRPDDPRAATYAAYSWLGWLQETLVRALS
ncbi:MAG TPA: DUF2017 domain-containing protein [Mycobacteriales bacterium]|nr:DUF2017 domain-containing protein [Mycobacteriales bacterium]